MKSGSERFIAVISASFLEGERCYSSHSREKDLLQNKVINLTFLRSLTFVDLE